MVRNKKNLVEYVGIEEVYGGIVLDRIKFHRLVLTNNEEPIFRIQFKGDLLDLEKVLNYDNEEIYIFHIYIQYEVYYQCREGQGNINSYRDEFINSYLVVFPGKLEKGEFLRGKVSIVNGYLDQYQEEEYITMEVALILGGTKS